MNPPTTHPLAKGKNRPPTSHSQMQRRKTRIALILFFTWLAVACIMAFHFYQHGTMIP
jgi:hypothetical protein